MEPRARNLQYQATAPTVPTDTEILARRERNARLVQEFGSQRRKRQLSAAKSAQVDASQLSDGAGLLGFIAAASPAIKSREAAIAASLSLRNIPPHNRDARTAEEAYRHDQIIPASLGHALDVNKLFSADKKEEYKNQLRQDKKFGEGYVLSRLQVLTTADKRAREERASCLALLGYLLKMVTTKGSVRVKTTVSAEANHMKMPESVLEAILELFYTREGGVGGGGGGGGGEVRYVLSKEKKNLMLGWILVLAIRAEPQCVLEPANYAALVTELRMKATDVGALYRELGCVTVRVRGEGGGTKVSLMPPSSDGEKTLADYFPGLKLGGKKR